MLKIRKLEEKDIGFFVKVSWRESLDRPRRIRDIEVEAYLLTNLQFNGEDISASFTTGSSDDRNNYLKIFDTKRRELGSKNFRDKMKTDLDFAVALCKKAATEKLNYLIFDKVAGICDLIIDQNDNRIKVKEIEDENEE